MAKPKPRTIDVEIFDQKYSIVLKSEIQEAEIRRIADDVGLTSAEVAGVAAS